MTVCSCRGYGRRATCPARSTEVPTIRQPAHPHPRPRSRRAAGRWPLHLHACSVGPNRPSRDSSSRAAVPGGFTVDDFTIDTALATVTCPAGKDCSHHQQGQCHLRVAVPRLCATPVLHDRQGRTHAHQPRTPRRPARRSPCRRASGLAGDLGGVTAPPQSTPCSADSSAALTARVDRPIGLALACPRWRCTCGRVW